MQKGGLLLSCFSFVQCQSKPAPKIQTAGSLEGVSPTAIKMAESRSNDGEATTSESHSNLDAALC